MIELTLAEVADAVGGVLHSCSGTEVITGGVEFDSRRVQPGGLFVALPGEIFAELTISCDRALDVERAHAIADGVEQRVASEVGAREVVVHVEPEATGQPAQRR